MLSRLSLVVLVSLGFQIISVNDARADVRVVPGAKIPLALNVPDIKEKMKIVSNLCLYEETLLSLLPKILSAQDSPGAPMVMADTGEYIDDRLGTNTNWIETSQWVPGVNVEKSFLEWVTPTDSVVRFMNLSITSVDAQLGEGDEFRAVLETDFENQNLNIELYVDGDRPYLETVLSGSTVCQSNEWGRELCQETAPIPTEVNLIVPQTFIPSAVWINSETGSKTHKNFSFEKYADCLLYNWEK